MFDYQAGEKQKLTLIMVGVTGAIVGASLTLFLAAPGEAPQQQRARGPRGRISESAGGLRTFGRAGEPGAAPARAGEPGAYPPPQPAAEMVAGAEASSFVQGILKLTWDFNSTTASNSQQQAMTYMTPECAQNYKLNVWTDEIAAGVSGAGMTSSFNPISCQTITNNPDGSAVVKVEGDQMLNLQGQPPRPKHVIMEYLVKKTPQGLKISGISESGNFGT